MSKYFEGQRDMCCRVKEFLEDEFLFVSRNAKFNFGEDEYDAGRMDYLQDLIGFLDQVQQSLVKGLGNETTKDLPD